MHFNCRIIICDYLSYEVTAIEAFPLTFKHLEEHIEINNIKNIQTFNLAIGDENKKIYFLDDENISWKDIIKGDVSFDAKNLSDPVLIRADGTLLYHLPSVIDDIEEKITHIIRGEDHIANTAYHIQIFKALDSSIPSFAHHPFLVDETGIVVAVDEIPDVKVVVIPFAFPSDGDLKIVYSF